MPNSFFISCCCYLFARVMMLFQGYHMHVIYVLPWFSDTICGKKSIMWCIEIVTGVSPLMLLSAGVTQPLVALSADISQPMVAVSAGVSQPMVAFSAGVSNQWWQLLLVSPNCCLFLLVSPNQWWQLLLVSPNCC